jgi:1,2-diacylglycerol 3-alpha-glucosyltransferase
VRILHFCLSCFYIDKFNYQENELVRQHVGAGHDVLVVASTETMNQFGVLEYLTPSTYTGSDGTKVIRLPYRFGPSFLARKLRIYSTVQQVLEEFKPDVIMFHGTCAWDVKTAAQYVKENPEVIFYVDSHEDRHNSARTFLSRVLLHKFYYRYCLRKALPQIRKILCYSLESMDFVNEIYGIDRDRLEFFPLGGLIPDDESYLIQRTATRKQLAIDAAQILYVQIGKQTAAKKLINTLQAFISSAPAAGRLIIAGSLDEHIKQQAEALIESDARIRFCGWLSPDQLTSLLCAADVYLQPGTQSVNFQQSLCCRCIPIVHDYRSHHPFVQKNGWMINTDKDLAFAISAAGNCNIEEKQGISLDVARTNLDYEVMAKRVLR